MLNKKDEIAFEKFRELVDRGDVPPLRVKRCPYKGYIIKALAKI
jgi:hypothetical protein